MTTPETPLLFFLLLLLLFLLSSPSLTSSASLTVSPKTLTKSNHTVHIRWSGVSSPSDLDWLGIYSPANSPDDEFLGYVFLNSSRTWRSGSGSISLPLVNLRSDYAFRIFRWTRDEVSYLRLDNDGNPLPATEHRLAESGPVGFEKAAGPDQIHLAFTDHDDEMRVMFVTADGEESFVSYGLDKGRLDKMAGTEVSRYERKDMCDYPANASIGWRDPGFIHDGVMKNLEKGQRYYYTVGSDSGGWSAMQSFISRDSDSNETIAFLFGDMGTYVPYATFYRIQEESKSTVKWILRDIEALGDKPAFISHIGDISYARGYAWIWDEFFNQIEPIASSIPYHVCIGNHEYDWPLQPWRPEWALTVYRTDGGGECGIPYSLRFRMPGNSSLLTRTGSPDTRNLYYSFDAGVVHFLYISTETNFLQGSNQYNFIKADLESVDRSKTPFIVVQGHRPMYTTSDETRDAPLRERMLAHLEPLFVQNNVTLALWGHVHRYERFCPVKNFSCVDMASSIGSGAAPVHVVIGMGGQDWQPTWEPRPDHRNVPIFPQPERSMYRAGEFGYTKLVATREKLTLTYIGNHDGEIHDMVEILSGQAQNTGGGEAVVQSVLPVSSWYIKGASLLFSALSIGYALGLVTRYRKDSAQRSAWAPVKNEEI
ncbi:probable inactive purple acid phosphatase 2 [Typha angustifolia]|uniref:probable inactive purple acid phosphatase 2 n=1 Tax=Typha angustifolia TaxID=59011 RepID=UPI003C30996A